MQALRELLSTHASTTLLVGGLLVGFVFGAVLARTNYCAMGALADIHNFNDYRRFRAWILAAAVALTGTQILASLGVVDLAKSMYLAPSITWVGNIAGGIVFGIGMVFAGGCPSRNLARAGSGDLRALVTLALTGLAAYMAIFGLVSAPRAWIEGLAMIATTAPTQALPDLLGGSGTVRMLVTAAIAATALAYVFSNTAFRTSRTHVLSGLLVGLCIVSGWAVTGLAYDELTTRPIPPISLTFVRPLGDTLDWLQRFSALPPPGFGVASVFGTLLGAFAISKATGRFRFATFTDTADTLRNFGGALLMGLGGATAMGCTIGQTLTGLSTLSLGSFLTFAGIVAGGKWALVRLEKRILAAA